MTFNSIDSILDAIAKQPKWEKQRQYHQLVQYWRQVVSKQVAQHTKPLYLQRQILWIATPNSVWSQNLTLQRYSLLQKLNQLTVKPIIDLRFSAAKWYQQSQSNLDHNSNLASHPSSLNLDGNFFSPKASSPNTPEEAFQKWMETLKLRSTYLNTCPLCQCPTPQGELQRWQMCSYCVAKNFLQ